MDGRRRTPSTPAPASQAIALTGRLELEVFVRAPSGPRPRAGLERVPADLVAYFVVPKLAGARFYTVSADGFDDPHYYGHSFATSFAPATAVPGRPNPTGFGDTRVHERDESYWIALAGVSTWADAFAGDWSALHARFAGARVVAMVSV